MHAAFARQEKEWIPCCDWGWKQKKNNEIYLRELKEAKRAEKDNLKGEPRPKRVRIYVPVSRDRETCKLCPAQLGYSNKSGVCAKCFSKHRAAKKGPRPICKLCPNEITRTNTIGICYRCATHAIRAGRNAFVGKLCACGKRLGNRNTCGLCKACQVAALAPKKQCAKCENILHPTNKTGLCVNHSAVARQQAYMARKKAA